MADQVDGPIRVVAAVASSDGSEFLVLNRPLALKYDKVGNDYIGSDGPFRDLLYYKQGQGRFVAFAGRELTLAMNDGTSVTVKDHWWSGHLKGTIGVVTGDIQSLKKCYVFGGGTCIAPADFDALRSTYTGCVYPYWDYEKVITFDDMRRDLLGRLFHEERRCKALALAVKTKHRDLVAAREERGALAAKCAELEQSNRDGEQFRTMVLRPCLDAAKSRIHDLEAKCTELELDREALYALRQGRVVDAFDEKNARIAKLEAALETATSALSKANELHFGPRMRRIEELEAQVRGLQELRSVVLKKVYMLYQPVAAPHVTAHDIQVAVHKQAEEIALLLMNAAPTAPQAQEPPLLGRWRHNNGVVCNGSMRIFLADIDTNPSVEFTEKLMTWVCDTLNTAIRAQEPKE